MWKSGRSQWRSRPSRHGGRPRQIAELRVVAEGADPAPCRGRHLAAAESRIKPQSARAKSPHGGRPVTKSHAPRPARLQARLPETVPEKRVHGRGRITRFSPSRSNVRLFARGSME